MFVRLCLGVALVGVCASALAEALPPIFYVARQQYAPDHHSTGTDFTVYEMDVDGGGLRQITDGAYADVDPAYLPDGRIVFSSTRDVKFCGCNWHVQGNIFRIDADGRNLLQLGHNTLYESRPAVLPDGRIIYERGAKACSHLCPRKAVFGKAGVK